MFGWLLIVAFVALIGWMLRWYRRTDPGSVYSAAAHAYVAQARLNHPRDH